MVPVFFYLMVKKNYRLLSCYTIIKRWLLPSTLYSCIRTTTSLFSLNHYFGTLFYAHGCFRLDYPPYHEQSEFSAPIHVIPRLTTNGKVSQPPNYALSLLLKINLSMAISAVPAWILLESHTYICFEEYQLSRSQIGLSPTILSSLDNTATLIHSVYLLTWPRIDHCVSGLMIVTYSRTSPFSLVTRFFFI